MKQEILNRKAVSIGAVILLFLALSAVLMCGGIFPAVLNTGYLEKTLEKSGYIDKNFAALQASLQREAVESGLPEDILITCLSEANYKKSLEANIQSAGQNSGYTSGDAAAAAWKEVLEKNLNAYFALRQTVSRQEATVIDNIVKRAELCYANYTTLPFGTYISKYRSKAFSIIRVLLPAAVLMTGILICLLLRVKEPAYRGWSYVCGSLLGAAAVSQIVGFFLRFGINYRFPKTLIGYQTFFDTFLSGIAKLFLLAGLSAVVVAAVGFAGIKIYENKQ